MKNRNNILLTIIAIITSLLIGIYFFQLSKDKSNPVYSFIGSPALIFDQEIFTPNFRLVLTDSTKINDNVYLSNIAIWNNGKLEIKKTDIRKPLAIVPTNGARIIDYKIIKETKPEIEKFKLNKKNSKLFVDWSYFDSNCGFQVQIIYSGNKESRLKVEGNVLGNEIKFVSAIKRSNIPFIKKFFFEHGYFTLVIGLVLFYLLFTNLHSSPTLSSKINVWIIRILFIIIYVIQIYKVVEYMNYRIELPF